MGERRTLAQLGAEADGARNRAVLTFSHHPNPVES